jgi:hypothetical protein
MKTAFCFSLTCVLMFTSCGFEEVSSQQHERTMPPPEFEEYISRWIATLSSLGPVFKKWEDDINDRRTVGFDPVKNRKQTHPLYIDANFRNQFDHIANEMANIYMKSNNGQREEIRVLLNMNKSYKHALDELNLDPSRIRSRADENLYHLALVFASMTDQGMDFRDFLLYVGRLNEAARKAGIILRPHLEEAALLSNDIDPFGRNGIGSTRELFLNMSTRE